MALEEHGLILHPSYFMDVISLVQLYHSDYICLEQHDSYVKQTYRNRCYIAAANGKLSLNIPIIHQGLGHSVPYDQVLIDHSQPWKSNHLKSIKSAYQSSPFYEYYEHDLHEVYHEMPDLLMELNIRTMGFIMEQCNIQRPIAMTQEYLGDKKSTQLITAKGKPSQSVEPYIQVFQEKHGFLQPLSSLDLLFNLGPSTGSYLNQQIVIKNELD